jgi:hypothetical protein
MRQIANVRKNAARYNNQDATLSSQNTPNTRPLHKPVCTSKLALFTTMYETSSQVNQYKHQKMQKKTPITGVPNVRTTQLGVA